MQSGEKDMVVMWHKFVYRDKNSGIPMKLTSSLVVTGDYDIHTAMAKTVGLPLAVVAKLFLTGKINLTGMFIPTEWLIYEPVLDELEQHGIIFRESLQGDTPEELER